MDLNNKRKKYVKIDQKTGSKNIFSIAKRSAIDLEDNIDEFRHKFCIWKAGFWKIRRFQWPT